MRDFFHSGDLGDVIYSLPTVRAMGGGRLFLRDEPGIQTMHGMTQARFDAISPLLHAQPYITDAIFGFPSGDCVNLNAFRRVPRDLYCEWLPNHYLDMNGVDRAAAREKWLTAPACHYGGVIVSRSARYHNDAFPWATIVERYGDAIEFVGTWAEFVAFRDQFAPALRYCPTADLESVAYVISGCDFFIGNQSCPLAIAEGLKKPILCEICPACPNCRSPRPDFFTELSDALRITSPAEVHVREPSGDGEGMGSRHPEGQEVARA